MCPSEEKERKLERFTHFYSSKCAGLGFFVLHTIAVLERYSPVGQYSNGRRSNLATIELLRTLECIERLGRWRTEAWYFAGSPRRIKHVVGLKVSCLFLIAFEMPHVDRKFSSFAHCSSDASHGPLENRAAAHRKMICEFGAFVSRYAYNACRYNDRTCRGTGHIGTRATALTCCTLFLGHHQISRCTKFSSLRTDSAQSKGF